MRSFSSSTTHPHLHSPLALVRTLKLSLILTKPQAQLKNRQWLSKHACHLPPLAILTQPDAPSSQVEVVMSLTRDADRLMTGAQIAAKAAQAAEAAEVLARIPALEASR